MNKSKSPLKKRSTSRKRDNIALQTMPTSINHIRKLADKYLFNEKEIIMIKNRFEKISTKGLMDASQFRDSLGIMGLESFLSDRIFNLIDENQIGQVSFEDFVRYISILLNGSGVEKALWSFKMLSLGKSMLELEDLEKMIFEMCYLWNSMTGSKSVPKKEFVEEIFGLFDVDQDGIVTFEEQSFFSFNLVFSEGIELIGWFEFLNNEDINLNRIKVEYEQSLKKKKKRATLFNNKQFLSEFVLKNQNTDKHEQKIKKRIGILQTQLQQCQDLLKQERESQIHYQNTFLTSFYQTSQQKNKRGPKYSANSTPAMWGDDDPIENESPFEISAINDRFQATMLQHLKEIMGLTQEIKKINQQQLETSTQNGLEISQQNTILKRQKTRNIRSMTYEEGEQDISQKTIEEEGVRKNLSIYFGHENWNLVLNMMIGIRKAVKNLHPLNDDIPINENHFQMKYQFEIITKRTAEFDYRKSSKFYEYAPMVFEKIRKLYNVSNDDYLRSVGPEQLVGDLIFGNLSSLTEKVSSGKSGSFFYYSFDDKYMLKTISRDEFLFFKKIINKYYQHLTDNFNTLIIKIFGLYKMKMFKAKNKQEKIYFVVMVNIFLSEFKIQERYDLKGSLYGRTSRSKTNPNPDISIPLKDLDWLQDNRKVNFGEQYNKLIREETEKDLQFFSDNKIIDYSFLVGFVPLTQQIQQQINESKNITMNTKKIRKRFYEQDCNGLVSGDKKYLYYFGIIDIFTEYNSKKKMEHSVKSTFVSKDISCIPPPQYAERYKNFFFQSVLE